MPQERTQNQLYVADITVRLQSILRSSGKEVSSAHTHSGPTVMPLCACAGCAQIILKMLLKTASSTGTEKKKATKIRSNLYSQGLQIQAVTSQM